MIETALVFLCLGLTITGFIIKNAPLLIAASISWIGFGFYMFGQTFPNTYMNTFFLVLGGAMTFVCLFRTINIYTSGRPRKPTLEDEQREYRKKVTDATRR